MNYSHRFFSIVILLLAVFLVKAEVPELKLSSNTKLINPAKLNGKETLTCTASDKAAKFIKSDVAEVRIYVKNEFYNTPFYLVDNQFNALHLNAFGSLAGKLVFTLPLKQLFSKPGNGTSYKWTWDARPESPSSPLKDVKGKKVRNLKCWCIITANGKNYSSQVISFKVTQ
jgi:hypothetical protein